jgi:hypothetical protein
MNKNQSVPCPFCKAEAGASCVNEDGSVFKTGIHMARWYELQNRDNEAAAARIPLPGEPEEFRKLRQEEAS